MLLKEEFTANMSYLTPSVNSMLCAGNGWIIIFHFKSLINFCSPFLKT